MQKATRVLTVIVAGALTGAVSCVLPLRFFIALVACALYAGLCAYSFRTALVVIMVLRGSLDHFNKYSIAVPGVGSVNAAAVAGLLVIAMAAAAVFTGEISLRTPLTAVWTVFLGTFAFCIMSGRDPASGIESLLKFGSLASFYLLVYNYSFADRKNARYFLKAIVFSSVIPMIAGVYQFATGTGNTFTPGLNRISGTFVHPNPFAYYLMVVISACVILLYQKSVSGPGAAAVWAVLCIALAELFLTYTRGAWIGAAFTAALTFLRLKDRRKGRWLLLAVIFLAPLIPAVVSRFTGITSTRMEESSLTTRFYIWRNMLAVSVESPLIGHGPGTFGIFARRTIGWLIEAHNEYLRLFFETGLIGLTVYILLVSCALSGMRSGRGGSGNMILVLAPGLFFSFLIMGAFDNIIDNLVSQWYLWAIIAIAQVERRPVREGACRQQVLLPEGGQ